MKVESINYRHVLIFSAALLLTACADNRPPEEIVAERAQARWDALVAREFPAAWQYHTPGFRARNPSDVYAREMGQRPIRWDAAEVLAVDCGEDECAVSVLVSYTAVAAPGPLAGVQSERPITESWLRMDGKWWVSVAQ